MRRPGPITLLLALGLCACRPTATIGSLTGLGCVVQLRRGVCAPVPRGFDLERCRLYAGADATGPGLPYGRGWARRTDTLADPCAEDGIALDLRGVVPDHRVTSTLVCNVQHDLCPAAAAPGPASGTRFDCQLSAPVANLGPGVTAATLDSDGASVSAALGTRPGEAGLELGLARLSQDLAQISSPELTLPDGEQGVCKEVAFWSRPVSVAGGAQLLASCAPVLIDGRGGKRTEPDTRTARLVLYSYDGVRGTARTVCPELVNQITAVDLGGTGRDVWAALSVGCTGARNPTPDAVRPFSACTSGPLVLPASRLSSCDRARVPLAVADEGDRAVWVDLAPGMAAVLRAGADGQAEALVSLPGLGGDLPVLPHARLALSGAEALEGNPPVLAERDGSVVIGLAHPQAGVVATRLEITALVPGSKVSDVPAFHHRLTSGLLDLDPPVGADRERPVQWPSLAIAADSATYAMCYTAGFNDLGGQLRLRRLHGVLHRAEDADRVRPTYCLSGYPGVDGELPCAVETPLEVPAEACAVAPLEGPLAVAGATFVYLVPGPEGSLHLVAPPDDLVPGKGTLAAPLYKSQLRGTFGTVADLQLTPTATPGAQVALVGQKDGRYVAYLVSPTAAGPTPAEPLWEGTRAGASRPRLRRLGDEVWVSFVEPRPGGALLRRVQLHPASGFAEVLLPPTSDAAALSTGTWVRSGPYANDTQSAASNAWLEGIAIEPGTLSTVRLLTPRPQGVSAAVLVRDETADPEGRWQAIAAFAPGEGATAARGPFVTRVSDDLTFRPQLSTIGERSQVAALAIRRLAEAPERLLALALATREDAEPEGILSTVPVDPTGSLPPVPLDGPGLPVRTAFLTDEETGTGSEPFVPEGGAELVRLAPGILGVSFCAERGGRSERRLQPVDLLGTPLGPAVDLGVQRTTARRGDGRPDCPPATLVWHGDRLLTSSVVGHQVVLRELVCGAR